MTTLQPFEPACDDAHDDHESNAQEDGESKRTSWTQRFLKALRRLMRSNAAVTWMVCLVAAAILGHRYRKRISGRIVTTLALLLSSSSKKDKTGYQSASESALSHLWEVIQDRVVQKVLLSGSSVVYYKTKNDSEWRRTRLPPNQPQMLRDIVQGLSRAGCSNVQVLPESLLSRLSSPLLAALPFVYLAFLYRMVQHFSNQHSSISSDSSNNKTQGQSHNATTFADVAGLDSILPDVSEIVQYLRNPAAYQALGAKPPRGILLHGPPGCGKTLIARAVAGEAAVDAFCACNASDFVEVFVGRGAARVRHLFQQLRQEAIRSACSGSCYWWQRWWLSSSSMSRQTSLSSRAVSTALLFIDELDALAKTRSVLSSSDEREQTLMQLLTEMDGFDTDDKTSSVRIVVMAASNRPDILDPAILRRFDRQIHVNYPDLAGRQAILQRHAKAIRWRDRIDWKTLATATAGWSGSDLRNVVNEAALLAVRDQSRVVLQSHLEGAIAKFQASRASSSRSSLSSLFPVELS